MTAFPRVISADSHVTEHPDTYRLHIERRYRDQAPHVARADHGGDVYVIPGMEKSAVPIGLIAAAGRRPEDISMHGRFEDWYPGGYEPGPRLADQDRDGVAGEILYPTVGMVLCNHPDLAYKRACMQAYNRWMAEYCAAHPDRLFGIGQTALRSPAEGVADLREIKALGLRGVMLPGVPGEKDYDDPMWDPFWEVAIALELPLSFHILTTPGEFTRARGPALNYAVAIIRANQDIIGMLIFGGVFERHPKLRIVCVEADAGWAPHWMYRMDHYYTRHHHLRTKGLQRLPSEQFREHVYLTFQDDWSAFATAELQNPERLMWANDFPHSDSCWPRSQEIIREHTAGLPPAVRDRILRDNVAELYKL
ncbi:MAG TPA: amidohydrolase family protein [Candidatus Limnocylindria bacterium]|nr:amidohydrolase family protein [Candidatus Limnocylindria bacterium]